MQLAINWHQHSKLCKSPGGDEKERSSKCEFMVTSKEVMSGTFLSDEGDGYASFHDEGQRLDSLLKDCTYV